MPMIHNLAFACLLSACGLAALAGETGKPANESEAMKADEHTLGPKVGAKAPDAALQTHTGEAMQLSSMLGKGPVVMVFYRGGWCPYCTKSLAGWDERMPEFAAAGATVMGLTPEKPGFVAETVQAKQLDFKVYSDHTQAAAKAYNLVFSLDTDTITKYKGYGIDLSERNANAKWDLPHPATILIDTNGIVRKAWVNEDYRTRVSPDEVLAALKELK